MTEHRATTDSATPGDASVAGAADDALSNSYNKMMSEFYKTHAADKIDTPAGPGLASFVDRMPTSVEKKNEAAAPEHSVEPTQAQLNLAYMQKTLTNFLPVVLASRQSEMSAPGGDKSSAQAVDMGTVIAKQKAIEAEANRGEFGPATKEAYGQYVDWLEKKAIPEAKRDLKYVGLSENEAVGKDSNASNLPVAPANDLKIDRNHPPDVASLERLDDAVKWTQRSDQRVEAATAAILKKVDGSYVESINKLGLPHGWLQDIERDHARWRTTVGGLINNALTMRSNLEVMDELNKAGGQMPLAAVLGDRNKITRDKDGKIAGIHLDLPRTWDLNEADNKSRAEYLARMVQETNAMLAPSVAQLRTLGEHPERAINWGDTEVRGMQGRFDAAGNFLGLIKKDDKVGSGEHSAAVNLVESRYSTEEKDGKIILHQKVQAQSVPWWGYQNLIGVENVGKPIDITRTFNPGDSVVVRSESGFEVKRADDLSSYRNWQMGKHYGGKVLMGALDAGMLVSGTIEVGAAFRAARMAGVGLSGADLLTRGGVKALTSEGVEVSSRMLAGQAGKGLMRSTVGATGLLNNAGARESSFGQSVNTARSVYFLADAAVGLGATGWRAGRSLSGRGESALAPASTALPGLAPGSGADLFYRFNHNLFKASEFGFAPMVGSEFVKSATRLGDNSNRHVIRAAEIVANDARANRLSMSE
ncbi:MAG: hypothetical protein KGS72_00090 [Cyanobacteria bacterium REEB67]|nr:hypothetical protein [Cyanobacteria bacterium REEB67]